MVHETVEETLNAVFDAEADVLGGAKRSERSDTRRKRVRALTQLGPTDDGCSHRSGPAVVR
jgi:hypothetical protein